MTGLILRLSAPLQSWGEHSAFNERDTAAFPTRSGLIGMFAAAEGRPRNAALDDYDPLVLTVRIDHPGTRLVDFHTVGGGQPRHRTVRTADGGYRGGSTTTLVSRRHYLTDAIFTVAVGVTDAASAAVLDRIAAALDAPAWAPYLGRRACIPDEPLLLKRHVGDPITELRTRTPLGVRTRKPPTEVDFVYEQPPPGSPAAAWTYEHHDVPTSFTPDDRRYLTRRLWRRVEPVAVPVYTTKDLAALQRYLHGTDGGGPHDRPGESS